MASPAGNSVFFGFNVSIFVKEILHRYPGPVIKKAGAVRALFFDVDGVLTDGSITYDDNGRELKTFNVKDGQIIAYLKRAGILVGVISGRESGALSRRAAELKLDFCHQGIVDKANVFEKLLAYHKLKKKQAAFVGDDLNDLGVFARAGFTACPADAPGYIQARVDLVTFAAGGRGVIREVADLILAAQGVDLIKPD
jgi:3-deoxy-D-manno-octulosonate 8-phosphate phosphatase (KDO 8-P phosphatase)